ADCNCRERFRPKTNQAHRFEHTACPSRCPQVLRIAWLRAKRMAVCEATCGARLIGLDMARLSVLAITAVAVTAISAAQAVDTSSNAAEAEGVTVTAEATGSLTSESPEESTKQKMQVPG